ncbi:MAG: sigma-54-dependent Fis family transcriptional regulator [Phycisphaerae bacterium]|nr:sigma-54-dependent Fis family transcriptional regulator [Phycisphaerae bacterium]
MGRRILVVDDEPLKRATLQIELAERGYVVVEAADARAARRLIDAEAFDAVVADVQLPDMSGLDLLTWIRQARPEVGVILMTAQAKTDDAVLAIKRGAYDYITKPFTTRELHVRLERLFALRPALDTGGETENCGPVLASRSPVMRRLFAGVKTAAGADVPILIGGERGVGKATLAAAIHALGPRVANPLTVVSSAGVPVATLERDLFGATRSTHDDQPKPPPVSLRHAHGGTLLIKDVDELPLDLQDRMVQAVERRAESPGEIGLICTTTRDLERLVGERRFRDDLYRRLNGAGFVIPPLRERPADIPLLARQFLARHADVRAVRISREAEDELMRHNWPGNVRELHSVLERGLAFCGGDEIRPEHVRALPQDDVGASQTVAGELLENTKLGLSEALADVERRMILMALRQCNGNQARAAERLGVPRTTLRDKIAKYHLPLK